MLGWFWLWDVLFPNVFLFPSVWIFNHHLEVGNLNVKFVLMDYIGYRLWLYGLVSSITFIFVAHKGMVSWFPLDYTGSFSPGTWRLAMNPWIMVIYLGVFKSFLFLNDGIVSHLCITNPVL